MAELEKRCKCGLIWKGRLRHGWHGTAGRNGVSTDQHGNEVEKALEARAATQHNSGEPVNKDNTEAKEKEGGQPFKSYAGVASQPARSRKDLPKQLPRMTSRGGVESSSLGTWAGQKRWLRGGWARTRVRVSMLHGQTVRAVMGRAKGQLCDAMEKPEIMGGVNDVL